MPWSRGAGPGRASFPRQLCQWLSSPRRSRRQDVRHGNPIRQCRGFNSNGECPPPPAWSPRCSWAQGKGSHAATGGRGSGFRHAVSPAPPGVGGGGPVPRRALASLPSARSQQERGGVGAVRRGGQRRLPRVPAPLAPGLREVAVPARPRRPAPRGDCCAPRPPAVQGPFVRGSPTRWSWVGAQLGRPQSQPPAPSWG